MSCVTEQPVGITYRRPASRDSFGFLPVEAVVPLRRRGVRIGFRFDAAFRDARHDGPPHGDELRITGYRYLVLDAEEREVLAYHWHPVGVSPVTFPHLHLSGRLPALDAGLRQEPLLLGGMHLPTGGMVTLGDVVRLLIAEFGVAPRRADWERVLAGAAG